MRFANFDLKILLGNQSLISRAIINGCCFDDFQFDEYLLIKDCLNELELDSLWGVS